MTYVVFSVWSLVTPAPAASVNVAVFTCNMGGVFNLIAYTVLRRKFGHGSGSREGGVGKQGGRKRTVSGSSITPNPVMCKCNTVSTLGSSNVS